MVLRTKIALGYEEPIREASGRDSYALNSVAKLFLGQSNARLIRVAILPGKNDSLKSRSRFFRCAKVVAIRVLQQYPFDSGNSDVGRPLSPGLVSYATDSGCDPIAVLT
jgi:hypothetical protein